MKSLLATVGATVREWRTPARRSDWARATRATAGFLIPLGLHATVGLPVPVVFAAIAAQNIAMVDVRGDYRLRLMLLGGMIVVLAAAGALGVVAAGQIGWAVVATMLVAGGAAVWRHVGSDYGLPLTAASALLFLISLDLATGWSDLRGHVGGILLGGAIGLALQMALWPLRAQHPLRVAASDSWAAAARLFETLQPGQPADALAAAEGELRTALDNATHVLAAAARHRRNALADRLEALSLRAARLSVRVMAVHTTLEGLSDSPVVTRVEPSRGPLLTNLINSARSIAVAVVSRQPAHLATCEVRLRRLEALLESMQARLAADAADADAAMVTAVIDQVRAVVPEMLATLRATLDRADERALFAVELLDVQTWQLKPLATALNFSRRVDPSLVRFGLRLAVCAGLGTAIYRWWDVPHGYWVPFTVVVVMQPDYGSTRRRAWQRLLGTLAGSALASVLLWLHPGPTAQVIGIGIGVFGFALLLKRHYAAAAFAATVFVVLLLEHAGDSGAGVTLERIGATLAGGVIALGAAMLFWPVWEHDRFAPVLGQALRETAAYLRRLRQRLGEGGGLDAETVRCKRRAEAASVTVFSSVGRLFADAHNPRAEMERAALLANGNRRVLRLANLMLVGLPITPAPASELRDRYFAAIEAGLERVAVDGVSPSTLVAADMEARERCRSALDHLPPVEGPDRAEPASLHLARAATEVRALLADVAT